jgi:hypothetical protein
VVHKLHAPLSFSTVYDCVNKIKYENVDAIKYVLAMQQNITQAFDVPWGGKRPGSGRKAGPEGKRELIAARVTPNTSKKLKAEAKRKGVTIGHVIDEWAKERK